MTYLQVKNWSEFQHYKDRNPPWIKLKTDIFQDYEFSRLQDASKLLAFCIWTLASRYKDPKMGLVPADLDYIKRQCCLGDSVSMENVKELMDQGFIIDASNMLADCKQSARPETETETETEITPKKILGQKAYSESFEKFWINYPKERRCEKPEAFKAWKIATQLEPPDKLINSLSLYKSTKECKEGYAPYPAKWLKKERYNESFAQSVAYERETIHVRDL